MIDLFDRGSVPPHLPPPLATPRERCIRAAVHIWATRGRDSITARAVGAAAGLSAQRVCQLFPGSDGALRGAMERLKGAAENRARIEGNRSVIAQIEASAASA